MVECSGGSLAVVWTAADPASKQNGKAARNTESIQHFPSSLTSLIGREQELQYLYTRLSRPDVRLLTLTGMPGVGKSHLALDLAQMVREEFAQGLYFVSLASVTTSEQMLAAIIAALDFSGCGNNPSFGGLTGLIAEKQVLLLIDGVEHLLSNVWWLTALLAACPHLKLLVTSRVALHLEGEYEYAVPPLRIPDPGQTLTAESVALIPSVMLFVERAESIKPEFKLTPKNAPLIAEICRQLAGIPLATELAAARIKILSLEELHTRLKQGLAVLGGGGQHVLARQRSMQDSISWSYELLTNDEKRLFCYLCLFEGAFTLEAAEAIVSAQDNISSFEILEGIASLVDKSLLLESEERTNEVHFYFLEIIRMYGLERLAANGDLERSQDRHLAYYLRLAQQSEGMLSGLAQVDWLKQLNIEYKNMMVVLERLRDSYRLEEELRTLTALLPFWSLRDHLSEGRERLLRASEEVRHNNDLNASLIAANAFYAAGHLLVYPYQREPELAMVYFAESLRLFRRQGDKGRMAACIAQIGMLQCVCGDRTASEASIEESKQLLQGIEQGGTCADVAYILGMVALYQGQYAEASQQLNRSLVLLTTIDNIWGMAAALHAQGIVSYIQGEMERACQFSGQSLALRRLLDTSQGILETAAILSGELVEMGEIASASRLLEEAQERVSTGEYREEHVSILCSLMHLELRREHVAEACMYLMDAAVKMQEIRLDFQSKWRLATCTEELGQIMLWQGEVAWAVQLCAVAETIRAAHGYDTVAGRKHESYERMLTKARRLLGEKAFEIIWADGQTMTLQQVITAKVPLPWLARESQVGTFIPSSSTIEAGRHNKLTTREAEVLCLLANGLSNGQIAAELGLSPYTVNKHTQSIYGKLSVNSRSAATRYAIEHRLL